jgi:hypothetical protein
MGGWIGGQADYVMVPYADFNLLKFPDKAHAMEKIRDLTCLSDILPTGFHGAVTAKVSVGSTVYVAGAGPVGLAAAASARILGAAWWPCRSLPRRGSRRSAIYRTIHRRHGRKSRSARIYVDHSLIAVVYVV